MDTFFFFFTRIYILYQVSNLQHHVCKKHYFLEDIDHPEALIFVTILLRRNGKLKQTTFTIISLSNAKTKSKKNSLNFGNVLPLVLLVPPLQLHPVEDEHTQQ